MRPPTGDEIALLLPHVASALHGSPFENPRRWASAVVVLRENEKRATSRAELAGFFTANDLPKLARECLSRKVAPGHVLVWLEVDTADVAAASFVVFDLAGAVRRVT